MKRVVVTGMSAITALGDDWNRFRHNVSEGRSAIRQMPAWDCYQDLNTRLAAPVLHFSRPEHYSRKMTRSMGRVSLMATRATELALQDAGLLSHPALTDGRCGIAYGSSTGSTEPISAFGRMLDQQVMAGVTATSYIQMMAHTTAVNIGVFFGVKGRIYTTSSACTSASQGIGYAYEAIKYGKQLMMIAGGAEELCVTEAAVFDTLFATSIRNDEPQQTPRPFDKARDGLVLGEGACTLILEELEHAIARGATIYAEVVGYGTNSDGMHVTQPSAPTMETAMRLALSDAGLSPDAIGYVNAHGTATDRGDIAESQATSQVFGGHVAISSLKSYLGHTLGACGAIESWASIMMMRDQWFAPTLNLTEVDPACGALDYIRGEARQLQCQYVMNNNFAFGGINTSLIFRQWAAHA